MQLEHNYNKAEKFVRSAAAQGAELAVLPEYHLTSWVPNDPGFWGLCDQSKNYLQKYRSLAKECKICKCYFKIQYLDFKGVMAARIRWANNWSGIVPGTIIEVRKENEEEKLLNVCYFINHEGNIVGKYVKKNLWYVEHKFSPRTFPRLPLRIESIFIRDGHYSRQNISLSSHTILKMGRFNADNSLQ